MSESDRPRAENETLRFRFARLSEAILRISEGLELDTVLREIAVSAQILTDARYGAITTMTDSGELQNLVHSESTGKEIEQLASTREGTAFFKHLTGFEESLRTGDFAAHARSVGFPDGLLPRTYLGTRIRDRTRHIGNIYVADKNGGLEFTQEDEETLEMFANQAAMAITNARRYGEERQAKADLEALVNTSPVGVVVFDAKTQAVVKFNQEAYRIMGGDRGRGPRVRAAPQAHDLSVDGRARDSLR